MAILTINLTAFTQTSSNDSVKCFTYEQVKKITKSIKEGQLCDSISTIQQLQINSFKAVLNKDEQIIQENNKNLLELTKNINKANLKLKISKRLTFYGVPIALGGGILLGIIISN